MEETKQQGITLQSIEKELQTSYLDYAMSVIVGRALPDVRDGLKPVHRRVLFSMYELSNTHDKPHKKSARIVGEVLGKYHPHGDTAIYDSLVRMAQDFSLRYTLVDGQGNFGSIDGDNPAAMRYTEVRMKKLADELLFDIDKDTIDFIPNFDGTLKEPTVLPSRIPNLLINGSSGIAVGMATNMPPHNLGEICDAILAILENANIDPHMLSQIVKGPDFPTGGIILGRAGILDAQMHGRGSVRIRSVAEIETSRKDKNRQLIKISELPYQVNKAELVKTIAELVRDKKIEGISDIQDLSDKKGIEVIIELKKGTNADVVLNQLYNKTSLETSFGIINLALVGTQPKILSLAELLNEFIRHRRTVIRRRSLFELTVAKDKKHILEGLKIALLDIDAVVNAIKASADTQIARTTLMSKWKLSEKQANAILDMKLSRLTSLERTKIDEENNSLAKLIKELEEILADPKKIDSIIKKETSEIKDKYADKRKTQIIEWDGEEVNDLDLVPDETVAVIVSENDYIKRISLSEYKSQRRGGRGVIGTETKESDSVKDITIARTHDMMLFFTSSGMVHWLSVYKIPQSARYGTGKAMVNLLDISDEKVSSWIAVRDFREGYLVMATKNGTVKRIELSAFSKPRRGGIRAITLREGDKLINVRKTDGKSHILISTAKGQSIKFEETEVREIGRSGQGVRGIDLGEGDAVVDFCVCNRPAIMTVCENGYGKRTEVGDYRLQGRGGSGIINIKTSERNGDVIGAKPVSDEDEMLLISSANKAIRIRVADVPVVGRNTQGVRLMKLDEGEKIVAIEHLTPEQMGENGNGALESNSNLKTEKIEGEHKPENKTEDKNAKIEKNEPNKN